MERTIEFYKVRTFSEKLNDAMDFFRQNWKTLLRMDLYLLLPCCVLIGICANSYLDSVVDTAVLSEPSDIFSAMGWSYSVMLAAAVMASLVAYCLPFVFLQNLANHGEDLSTRSVNDIWPMMARNMRRAVLAGLMIVGILVLFAIVMGLLAVISRWTLVITIPALLACCFGPLPLFCVDYLMDEKTGIIESLMKGFRYGFKTWGGTFAVILVLSIIIGIICSVLSLPGLFMLRLKATIFPDAAGVGYIFFMFLAYVLVIFANFVQYYLYSILLFGIGFQYGHAAEKLDGVRVDTDIEKFNEL